MSPGLIWLDTRDQTEREAVPAVTASAYAPLADNSARSQSGAHVLIVTPGRKTSTRRSRASEPPVFHAQSSNRADLANSLRARPWAVWLPFSCLLATVLRSYPDRRRRTIRATLLAPL